MGLISIIVPVSERVNRLVLQCKQLEKLASDFNGFDFEFIFVADGSYQKSVDRLKGNAQKDKRYRLIVLTRDYGATAAFLAGITYASGDCVGFFSGRNLDPSQVFGELIHHWESGEKIVLGKWEDPGSRSRRSRGSLFSDPLLRRKIFPNRIYFQDISSLLIDKEVSYILSQITDPFSDVVEILAWTGIQSYLVEYSHQPEPDGSKQLKFQHQSISLNYSEGIYSPKSFRTSLSIGFCIATFGVLITAGLIISSTYNQTLIPDWWMLTGVVIFMVGIQLILMGVFGEQIYRSLEKIRSRPIFVVDSIINPPVSSSEQGREKIEKMILSLWSIRKQKVSYASSASTHQNDEAAQE